MQTRKYVTLFISIVSLSLVLCKDGENTNNVINYSNKPYQCETINADDNEIYHFSYPQGGETFYVGDTVNFYFCSEDVEKTLERVTLSIFSNANNEWVTLPIEVRGSNFLKVAITDSLYSSRLEKNLPIVSDNCLLKISPYSQDLNPAIFSTELKNPIKVRRK